MSTKSEEEIDQDIGVFLNRFEQMTNNDRRNLLRAMFKKHIIINEADLVLSYYDFSMIVSAAKSAYSKDRIPEKIGGKDFYSGDAANLFLIEAVIGFLNSKEALRKFPKFR